MEVRLRERPHLAPEPARDHGEVHLLGGRARLREHDAQARGDELAAGGHGERSDPARHEREDRSLGMLRRADLALVLRVSMAHVVDEQSCTVDGVRAAFALTISDDGESSLRSPSLLNLIALLGVIGSGAYALSPLALRLYRRLDLTPAVVTAAVGATLAGIVIVIIGIAASANVFDNYAQLALPPPQIVNPILPDGDSLGRGAALFADVCPTWREAGDFNELVERLPRLRDEAIYDALTRTGWRALPACANQLTETQRWDIVNTIRAFETNSPTNGS